MDLRDSERKIILIFTGVLASVVALAIAVVAIDNYRTNRFVEDQVESANEVLTDFAERMVESEQSVMSDLARSSENMRRQARIEASRRKRESARRAKEAEQRIRAARSNTELGKTLFRKCREYSDFYRQTPGPFAQQQQQEACGGYQKYIETGAVPRTR